MDICCESIQLSNPHGYGKDLCVCIRCRGLLLCTMLTDISALREQTESLCLLQQNHQGHMSHILITNRHADSEFESCLVDHLSRNRKMCHHRTVTNMHLHKYLSLNNYFWAMPKHLEYCLDLDTFIILCRGLFLPEFLSNRFHTTAQ